MSKKTSFGLTRNQMRAYRDYRREGATVEEAVKKAGWQALYRGRFTLENSRKERAIRRAFARHEKARPEPLPPLDLPAPGPEEGLTGKLNHMIATSGPANSREIAIHSAFGPSTFGIRVGTTCRFRRLKRLAKARVVGR